MVARRKAAAAAKAKLEQEEEQQQQPPQEQEEEEALQVDGGDEKAEAEEDIVVDGEAAAAATTDDVPAAVEDQQQQATVEQEGGADDSGDVVEGSGAEGAEQTASSTAGESGDVVVAQNAEEKPADVPLQRNTTDSHSTNDSAAVVAYLSSLRLSVGPLTLEQIHDSSILQFIKKCSGCQTHVPRVSNDEEDQTKYGILDIEFLNAEDATECKEALRKYFEDDEKVKVENWPETKIYYNDYAYLKIDEKVSERFKQGPITAGYHKLRDRWNCAIHVDEDITEDKIKEMIGDKYVCSFRKGKKVYIRFDTKESSYASIDKSFSVNGKTFKIKALIPHPQEFNRRNNNNMNMNGRNNYNNNNNNFPRSYPNNRRNFPQVPHNNNGFYASPNQYFNPHAGSPYGAPPPQYGGAYHAAGGVQNGGAYPSTPYGAYTTPNNRRSYYDSNVQNQYNKKPRF